MAAKHQSPSNLCQLISHKVGFSSFRKYGFLHSSWEVIKARRTGSTHTPLDYVVYRLFYVLTLCGISVYKLSQSTPIPFLLYFETWVHIAHTLYAFVFLRQVLAHNHHHKALGRLQKMPEQLIITEEIERDGQRYYISKKISVLPRSQLSAYEKFVWILFNISSTMCLVALLAQKDVLSVLVRKPIKADKHEEHRVLLVVVGFCMIFMDLLCNSLPMTLGHAIHPLGFFSLYVLVNYLYESKRVGNRKNLYMNPIWELGVLLKLIGLIIISHIVVVLMAKFRDFVVSLLDRSRNQSNQQALRTQKRLARRKLMTTIYGPDGTVDRIVLEHSTRDQDDFIYWKENHGHGHGEDWAGESESEEVVVAKEPPRPVYGANPNKNKVAPAATIDIKPVIPESERKLKKLDKIVLPTPPSKNTSDTRNQQPFLVNWKLSANGPQQPSPYPFVVDMNPKHSPRNPKHLHHKLEPKNLTHPHPGPHQTPKRISNDRLRLQNSPPTPPQLKTKRKSQKFESGNEALIKAIKREYNVKLQKSSLFQGRPEMRMGPEGGQPMDKAEDPVGLRVVGGFDPEFRAEHKKYLKLHQEHEMNRLAFHNQVRKDVLEMQKTKVPVKKLLRTRRRRKSASNREKPVLEMNERGKGVGILKQFGDSAQEDFDCENGGAGTGETGISTERPKRRRTIFRNQVQQKRTRDKVGPQGEEGRVPPEEADTFQTHPGIPILIPVIPENNAITVNQAKVAGGAKEKESVIAFHPLIQYYEVPVPEPSHGRNHQHSHGPLEQGTGEKD